MKPAAFDYTRPSTVAEALAALASTPGARVLAGGQTLGPMLNLRLARPPLLVDITRIPELGAVTEESDAVSLGAAVTHAAIEDGRIPDPTGGFLSRVARGIAYRAVRTRGTVGGSLAHADPSADWLACLTALRAAVVIAGHGGERRHVRLPAFVRGAMETVLQPSELIVGVRIPRAPREARFGFHKICRKTGEFADAIGSVAVGRGGVLCVAAGATLSRPLVMAMPEAEAVTVDAARALLTAAGFAGDAYDLALHATALKRAYDEALAA